METGEGWVRVFDGDGLVAVFPSDAVLSVIRRHGSHQDTPES